MDRVDVLVVGAGVVGLAVAKSLAEGGYDVAVIEAEDAIGTGISSRNSEVIHAGIYYSTGSLKAQLCVEGSQLLYEYCQSHWVPHARTGKLIVAVDLAQEEQLAEIEARAARNQTKALSWLTQAKARELEPVIKCSSALWSPASGILDTHRYMLALQGDIEAASGIFVLRNRIVRSEQSEQGLACEIESPGERTWISARLVVNCAGLSAWEVARALSETCGDVPPRFLAKGHYFILAGRSPFRHLVYPVPVSGGLGTHVTIDLAGACRFGPDVSWIDEIDYTFSPGRKSSFVESIRRYWPDLPAERLQEGYVGIRPKLVGPGGSDADFMIMPRLDSAASGAIHLFGIESPGLTASLAIGRYVLDILQNGESSDRV
jgi:L-2-hydroxyglutarate oxidase LhgO